MKNNNTQEIEDSLNISQSEQNMLLSNNLSDLLQSDYYNKFKIGQNIYEISMTGSRLSMTDKTVDDNNNNTYIKVIHSQERLAAELYKNQVLENQLTKLQEQLNNSLSHNNILQTQVEHQQQQIDQTEKKQQKIIKNLEIEKLLNSQLMKKIQEQQEIIKQVTSQRSSQQKQLNLKEERKQTKVQPKGHHQKSYQSICSSNRVTNNKAFTEDSTIKDTSGSDLKSMDSHQNKKLFKEFEFQCSQTAQNFWSSPAKFTNKITLEKRIEATLAQIKSIKLQFSSYK